MPDGDLAAIFKGLAEDAAQAGGDIGESMARFTESTADIEDENVVRTLAADAENARAAAAIGKDAEGTQIPGGAVSPADTGAADEPGSIGSLLKPAIPASAGDAAAGDTATVGQDATAGAVSGPTGDLSDLARDVGLGATPDEALKNLPDDSWADLPDGSWIGKEHGVGMKLSPEQNAAADDALEHAAASEPGITHELQEVTDSVRQDAPGTRLVGPDVGKQLKSAFSFKRKLYQDLRDPGSAGADPRIVASNVNDTVRYTAELPPDHYAEGVNQIVDDLRVRGFEPVKSPKNFWQINRGVDEYKGINSTWRYHTTGQKFEFQFHTPESLNAKELSHPYYEMDRLPDVSEEMRREALGKAAEIFHQVHEPPRLDQVKHW